MSNADPLNDKRAATRHINVATQNTCHANGHGKEKFKSAFLGNNLVASVIILLPMATAGHIDFLSLVQSNQTSLAYNY